MPLEFHCIIYCRHDTNRFFISKRPDLTPAMTADMTPATFESLPVELKLEIIEILYDESMIPSIMTPRAAWTQPYYYLPGPDSPDKTNARESAISSGSVFRVAENSITPLKMLRLYAPPLRISN